VRSCSFVVPCWSSAPTLTLFPGRAGRVSILKNLQRWQDQQEGFSEAGSRRKLYPPTHNLWEIDGDAWWCQPERPLGGRRGRNARRSAPVASLTELGEGREPLRDWSADMTP
jgi:hypothetical protein